MSTLTITLTGTPAPKGSLRHVGHGRLIEQVKGSKPWRERIAVEAARERDRAGWECLTEAVTVEAWVYVQRPKTVTREYPIKRSAGDVDKHARNILDALVDAHIITDDSQVIGLHVHKLYAGADGAGAVIRVAPLNGTVDNREMPVESGEVAA
ncbi:MAG: RusA family crossover junction endodeoxyribonuclease [Rhodoglobus sp.]